MTTSDMKECGVFTWILNDSHSSLYLERSPPSHMQQIQCYLHHLLVLVGVMVRVHQKYANGDEFPRF